MLKNTFKIIFAPFICLCLLMQSGYAEIYSNKSNLVIDYRPQNRIATIPTSADCVEMFDAKPKKACFYLGTIGIKGNQLSTLEDILEEARKKGAELGADFIIIEKTGFDRRVVINAQKHVTIKAKSISPDNYPWGIFSACIYKQSIPGIYFDDGKDNRILTGFHPDSSAESEGMKIGDLLVEIDGIKLSSEGLIQHLDLIKPGDKNTYTMLRNGEKLNFIITALPNISEE